MTIELAMRCVRAVEDGQIRLNREFEDNSAHLGGDPFGRSPRRLTDAEKTAICERVLRDAGGER